MNRTRMVLVGLIAALLLSSATLVQAQGKTPAAAVDAPVFTPADGRNQRRSVEQSRVLSRVEQEPTTAAMSLVHVNPAALLATDTVRVTMPGGKPAAFKLERREVASPADFSWSGSGPDGSRAFITVSGTAMAGSFVLEGTRYSLEPLGEGLHALIAIDERGYPKEHIHAQVEAAAAPLADSSAAAAPAPSAVAAADAVPEMTLLVAYTPEARAAVADIEALITHEVKELNDMYVASGVNARVKLVFTYEVQYTETGNVYTDLYHFRSDQDAYMAEVHRYRAYAGADMAMIITARAQACGFAVLNAVDVNAFALTKLSCLSGYAFAHELGHVQGLRHNIEEDPMAKPYADGHGYLYIGPDRDSSWRTVMAYDCDPSCATWIPYFSNPALLYKGVPMGNVNYANETRVLNFRAPTVAGFRSLPQVWCNGQQATLVGTGGDDQILGTLGNDIIAGLAGNDEVHGRPGDDTICGNDGNDVLIGAKDNDRIIGDGGDDLMYGNVGDDMLEGGIGADTIYGGQNNDRIYGGDGNDALNGDLDTDFIDGGFGSDTCATGESLVSCP